MPECLGENFCSNILYAKRSKNFPKLSELLDKEIGHQLILEKTLTKSLASESGPVGPS